MKRYWGSMIWLLALLLLVLCVITSGRESWQQHARLKEFDRLIREQRELKEKSEPNSDAVVGRSEVSAAQTGTLDDPIKP